MRATLIAALAGFLIPILVLMGFNFQIDRYQYYHRHDGVSPVYSTNSRWQNPGLLRTHGYDTALIGTSRSQNFQGDMFSDTRWQVIKVTAPGMKSPELLATLELALKQRQTRRVLLELSYPTFTIKPWRQAHTFPEFLYQPSLETPFLYLLSSDLFWQSNRMVKNLLPEQPLDTLNVWGIKRSFGRDLVLESLSCNRTIEWRVNAEITASVDRLAALIQTHRDIEVIAFFPPMAGLALRLMEDGALSKRILFREAATRTLDKLPNVRLYDFAIADIVLNLDRYKDIDHYDMDANRWMAAEMHNPESAYLADPHTLNASLERIRQRVEQADVELARIQLASECIS